MRKRMLALLCTLAMTVTSLNLLPVTAVDAVQTGTTYYISSKNGNNAASGTSQKEAWETLDMLIGLDLQPGDTVLLEKGSVFDDSYIHLVDVHGTEEAPITIGSYGEGDRPAIHANGQGIWYQDYKGQMDNSSHKSKSYISSTVLLYDVDFVEISDLELTNQSNDFDYFKGSIDSVSEIKGRMGRTGVSGIAKDDGTSHHIYLDNLYIHDVNGNIEDKHINNGGIQINAIPPENEEATGVARYDDVRITNCYVRKVSRAGICVGYTYKAGQFGGQAIADEKAIKYGHTNLLLENNYIKDIGNDGIVAMYAYRPLIQNNISDHAGADLEKYSGFHNALCAGIWPWKCKDAIFQYNEVFDMVNNQDGQPWDVDYSDGTIYQYNYSHNNGGGCLMICGPQAYNSMFRYNISQNDLKTLIALPSNPNGEIYNNVFYLDGSLSTQILSGGGAANIKNNIFYNISTGKNPSETIVSNGRTFANNIFYGYDGFTLPAGSLTVDPKFVDPGNSPTDVQLVSGEEAGPHDRSVYDGYKLQADSPAINAGTLVSGISKYDFFGNEVGLIPDIGAYESDTAETGKELELKSTIYRITIENDTIQEVPRGTTVEELLDQLVCAKGSELKIQKGSSDAALNEAVTEDMTVVVSNGSQSKSYAVQLEALQMIIADTRITVGTNALQGVPRGMTVEELLAQIVCSKGVELQIKDGSSNAAADAIITSSMTLVISNGSESKTYTIALADLCIAITDSQIVVGDSAIQEVPRGTTVAELLDKVVRIRGAEVKILDGASAAALDQRVTESMTAVITYGDETKTYTIQLEALEIDITDSDIVVRNKAIRNVPKDKTVEDLLNAMVRPKGSEVKILDGDSEAALDANVTDTMKAVVSYDDETEIYIIRVARTYAEYDRTSMTASAGSVQGGAENNDNKAANVLDGNTSTIWHTNWSGCKQEDNWIEFDLGAVKPVARVKYVSRATGGLNGVFESYEVLVRSSESEGWIKVDEGTWKTSAVGSTEYAMFDTVNARYVRLVCTKNRTATGGSEGKIFGSASEIRIEYEVEAK